MNAEMMEALGRDQEDYFYWVTVLSKGTLKGLKAKIPKGGHSFEGNLVSETYDMELLNSFFEWPTVEL